MCHLNYSSPLSSDFSIVYSAPMIMGPLWLESPCVRTRQTDWHLEVISSIIIIIIKIIITIIIDIIIIICSLLRVFHTSVRVTSLFKSTGLFSVFWSISIIL